MPDIAAWGKTSLICTGCDVKECLLLEENWSSPKIVLASGKLVLQKERFTAYTYYTNYWVVWIAHHLLQQEFNQNLLTTISFPGNFFLSSSSAVVKISTQNIHLMSNNFKPLSGPLAARETLKDVTFKNTLTHCFATQLRIVIGVRNKGLGRRADRRSSP